MAFAQGVDGRVEEDVVVFGRERSDTDFSAICATITWRHARGDKNCPWPAAERMVAQLPTATLTDLGDEDHFAGFIRDGEILDELLERG